MPRYELTLDASYLPNWDTYAGIRELVQNARDAEVQYGAKMTVEHKYRIRSGRPVGTVIITNEGATIPREALLIGYTSKDNRPDLIGHFGEGLKFGLLALLRLGLSVKMRNGSETWTPLIVRSEKFNRDVLAIDVSTGHNFENRISIEILGVDGDDWDQMKKKFLFITPPQAEIAVRDGRILLDPDLKGNIYVKGMFVCHTDSYFGYDSKYADIDRDRRMISDRDSVTAGLLTQALNSGYLTDKIYQMLHAEDSETRCLYYGLNEAATAKILDKFQEQYGEDAFPVTEETQVTELSHVGKKGVKVPRNLVAVLSAQMGSYRDTLTKLRMGVAHTYQLEELTEAEREVFEKASTLLNQALHMSTIPSSINETRVVDFVYDKLRGTYDPTDESIRLSRKMLSSVPAALTVLIHEAAHVRGYDGSKSHEDAISELTERVFSLLLK